MESKFVMQKKHRKCTTVPIDFKNFLLYRKYYSMFALQLCTLYKLKGSG